MWGLVVMVVMVIVGEGSMARYRRMVDYMGQDSGAVHVFLGNQTHSDHFKLLRQDGDSLLIGARNVVYNLSVSELEENLAERIQWNSRERDTELCLVKGKGEDECNNYIRVLAPVEDGQLLVCGTNSFNPRCRNYVRNEDTGQYSVVKEFSGRGYCPYDPVHNSSYMFTGGELYSATVSDFSGTDALVIKGQIRTEQYNLKHLNGPDFVGSAQDDDFVYFFFREEAVEFMNCGKHVYSRVGRVCKNDQGGPHTFHNKWTTFLKARLNCSVSGQYPFYFDEVQSVSGIVTTQEGDSVFGIFNTPDNSIPGSAVCSFLMSDIKKSFEGAFKSQNHVNANWLPMDEREVPTHRPGTCSNDSRSLDEEHLNFLKGHSLMDLAVSSSRPVPHYIRTSPHERLTTITVDPSVPTAGPHMADIIWLGSTRGRVLKLLSYRGRTVLLEELQVFPIHVSVQSLLVTRKQSGDQETDRLIALSDHEVKSVPLDRCQDPGHVLTCSQCVALQDPSCAWNLHLSQCVRHYGSQDDAISLLQSLDLGFHAGCGDSTTYRVPDMVPSLHDSGAETGFMINMEDYYDKEVAALYSKEGISPTVLLLCVSSCLLSLCVGLCVGFCVSRKCFHSSQSRMDCGHAYLEAQMLERQTSKARAEEGQYEPAYTVLGPTDRNTTKNNLLSNQPVVSKDTTKPSLTMTNTGGSLGKCKKIYL